MLHPKCFLWIVWLWNRTCFSSISRIFWHLQSLPWWLLMCSLKLSLELNVRLQSWQPSIFKWILDMWNCRLFLSVKSRSMQLHSLVSSPFTSCPEIFISPFSKFPNPFPLIEFSISSTFSPIGPSSHPFVTCGISSISLGCFTFSRSVGRGSRSCAMNCFTLSRFSLRSLWGNGCLKNLCLSIVFFADQIMPPHHSNSTCLMVHKSRSKKGRTRFMKTIFYLNASKKRSRLQKALCWLSRWLPTTCFENIKNAN